MDKDQHFIVFNASRTKDDFSFVVVRGNPIPVPAFEFTGQEGESYIIGITLKSKHQTFPVDYSFVFSHTGFVNRVRNIKEFAIDIIKSTIDFNRYRELDEKRQYMLYLDDLKQQMGELFFDETVGELTIDKFIESNPIILEHGLNLIKPKHQVVLKNILGIYEHDLKPDLIAFDLMEKNWLIVDYKKAKRTIIKNLNKVRTGFKAEVNDLENQLYDYIEYFEEREHREFVNQTYQIPINDPNAIGLIGNVNIQEKPAFTRLMKNKARWFKVIPYNYLFDNFSRYVDHYRIHLK